MYKSLNKKLSSFLETNDIKVSIKDFCVFCENKGYTIKTSSKYDDHYIIIIDGYKVLIAATYCWVKDLDAQILGKIEFDSVNFTGYMRETQKNVTEFNSIEEYYQYTLDTIIEFAHKRMAKNKTRRDLKQSAQTKLNKLNSNESVQVTKQELLTILKQLEDDTTLTVQLG